MRADRLGRWPLATGWRNHFLLPMRIQLECGSYSQRHADRLLAQGERFVTRPEEASENQPPPLQNFARMGHPKASCRFKGRPPAWHSHSRLRFLSQLYL